MAVLNSSDQLTALELIKRNGYDADQRRIIEAMSVTNQILMDVPVFEANDGAVHTHLVRTALPEAQRRKLNEGVKSVATQTETKRDIVTEIANESIVDAVLVERALDKNAFLMDEASGIIEGMGITQAEDIVYGDNRKDAASINGFATRRAKIDDKLCVNFGGSGSGLSSVFLCKMGRRGLSYIYPRGAEGVGVKRVNNGVGMVEKDGKRMRAYSNYFSAQYGLSVGDERSLIRIANIGKDADMEKLVKEILHCYRNLMAGDGSVVLYANPEILHGLDMYIMGKGNVNYSAQDPLGRATTFLRDIRLRQVDQIRSDETALTK